MGLLEKLDAFDQGVWNFFVHHHRSWLNGPMIVISAMASRPALAAGILVLAVQWRRGMPRRVVTGFVAAFALSWLLAQTVKGLIDRERPEVAVDRLEAQAADGSFPSERALTGTAVYGTLLLLFAETLQRRVARLAVLATWVGLAGLIGVSRLYIGACYPTDVVAGWAAGAAIALACSRWAALPQEVMEPRTSPGS